MREILDSHNRNEALAKFLDYWEIHNHLKELNDMLKESAFCYKREPDDQKLEIPITQKLRDIDCYIILDCAVDLKEIPGFKVRKSKPKEYGDRIRNALRVKRDRMPI